MLVMEDKDLHLFTLEEVAQRLRKSKYTVKRYIDQGVLEGVRIGSQWRVRPEALRRYIEKMTKPEDKN